MSKPHYKDGKFIILSGAGLSAESGLSTFRDSGGLWACYDPKEVCNYLNWEKNYNLVHEFYSHRRVELGTKQPNKAHLLLAELSHTYDCLHLTQNVDDLMERAGAKEVIHLHGQLRQIRCIRCHAVVEMGYQPYEHTPCPVCGHKKMKPNVVFFNEAAPLYEQLWTTFAQASERDIILIIGTSGQVLPITSLIGGTPAYLILNNLAQDEAVEERLFRDIFYEPATKAIPKIVNIIKSLKEDI